MNHENFIRWMCTQILLIFTSPSVLILDNASYHSVQFNKRPTMISLKSEILVWLPKNCQVYFDAELMLVVKEFQIDKQYIVDNIIYEHVH
ncbi:hypothetical protein C0J52_26198 [Blattella germanica]|nr:hypothetical protein C0J52_26198 [Blattella germanica]